MRLWYFHHVASPLPCHLSYKRRGGCQEKGVRESREEKGIEEAFEEVSKRKENKKERLAVCKREGVKKQPAFLYSRVIVSKKGGSFGLLLREYRVFD